MRNAGEHSSASLDEIYARVEDAFVSFVSGHLVSPNLDAYYQGDRLSSFEDQDLAKLIHELTHHFCLTAPLSQVVAYLAASSAISRSLDGYFGDAALSDPSLAWVDVLRPRHFNTCLPYLLAGFRWLLEGLAVFAQADWFPDSINLDDPANIPHF